MILTSREYKNFIASILVRVGHHLNVLRVVDPNQATMFDSPTLFEWVLIGHLKGTWGCPGGTHKKLMDEFSRNKSSSCPGNWSFKKNWMSFPEIGLCHAPENWNFGKISGWVFQDLSIMVNPYWQIMENSSKNCSEIFILRFTGKLIHSIFWQKPNMICNIWSGWVFQWNGLRNFPEICQ